MAGDKYDKYTAAAERGFEARRAGLQAKKDEQPANTARSYLAKQREWIKWCETPRAAQDGTFYTWPDGELVTPDKLAAWLKEDVLLRRVKKKPGRKGRTRVQPPAVRPPQEQQQEEQADQARLMEVKALAETLEVPLTEAVTLLANDRMDYIPPAGLAPSTAEDEDDSEGPLLVKSTVDAYVAAVIELWRIQVANGSKNTENPRSAAVRGFLEQRGRQRGRQDRENYKDRGSDGIQAGYSDDEWLRVQEYLLGGAAQAPQNLRTRIDLLLGHYYLLRGENRRKMELADLSLLDYPQTEGPTTCGCLVSLLQDGKMNKTAKKEFMGSLRHKDPMFCTQGALAQLLFWRWHIAGEAPPSFRSRQDWYRIKVLVGQNREQELSYPTQLQETWRVFGAVGLATSKKTHLPRRAGAQAAETYGTSLAQISQAGRWNQSVLCQAYLTHLPRQFMRIVAGFSGTSGDYFLTRAAYEPPDALQRQLWPWVEEWEPRFEARARRCRWARGGLDEDDLAGDGFLKLMRRLRIVLLQDLAVLQPRFPSLPFFDHTPFCGPQWDEFAHTVQAGVGEAVVPQSLLVQRALPELYSLLESTGKAILHSSQQLTSQLAQRLEEGLQNIRSVQNSLDALLQGKAPITITATGYFNTGPGSGPVPGPGLGPVPGPGPGPGPGPMPGPGPELGPEGPSLPTGSPIIASLAKAFTVQDVWKQWVEGFAGQPAVRGLEERWGARWRPGNAIRVEFCRRKIIWDAILSRMARGKSEEEAVAELEALRAGQSLRQLVDRLRRRRRRRQEQENSG